MDPLRLIHELRGRPFEPFEEVFSHEDTDVTPPLVRHFLATRIREFAERVRIDGKPMPVHTVDYMRTLYDHIVKYQGTESQKIARLRERMDIVAQPVLVAEMGDKHLVVDGSHRLRILWEMGLREFKAYFIPEFIWNYFLIDYGRDDPDFVDFSLGRGKYGVRNK